MALPILIGSLGLAYLTHRKIGQLTEQTKELRESNEILMARHDADVAAESHLLAEADALDKAIANLKVDPVFRASWKGWLARARQANTPVALQALRRDLGVWRERVGKLTGRALGKGPVVGAETQATKTGGIGGSLPWYGWIGVGAGVAALGYGAYRWQKGRETARDALFAKYDTTRLMGPHAHRDPALPSRNPLRLDSYSDAASRAPVALGGEPSRVPAPQYALTRRDEPPIWGYGDRDRPRRHRRDDEDDLEDDDE